MSAKFTYHDVRAMSPGERTAAYFRAAIDDKGRLLLAAQQAFVDNPPMAVAAWMERLRNTGKTKAS